MLVHKLASQPVDSYAQQLTLQSSAMLPQCWTTSRHRGRPRPQWVSVTFEHALKVAESSDAELPQLLTGSTNVRRKMVSTCCHSDRLERWCFYLHALLFVACFLSGWTLNSMTFKL
ncbi:unnamed protein product [Polarella glacialis]|uniref:Uncharacterized protein n=1 Tax=Polarella glacialis TaxID=89957 RepID=A0A813KQA0_POLGL|nr:unnamed protein product [Polarella glacialis]CAE8710233.1 unnamed protein product [Polarella glacialis]